MHELLKLIQNRQSLRTGFDPGRPVSKADLESILEAGRWAPTAHNMQNFEVIVVDDKKLLESIGKLKFTITPAFVKENYRQLSFSEEELLKKKTGILAKRFPEALTNPDTMPDKGTRDKLASFQGLTIQNSPALLIVLYDPANRAPDSEGDFLGVISLGCFIENMWLMANSLGLGFHIVSALGTEAVEGDLKHLLHIPQNLKVVFSIRLGYPISTPPPELRVRRDVADFTHHNLFGNKGLI